MMRNQWFVGQWTWRKLDLDNGREESGPGADVALMVDARLFSIIFQEAQPDYEHCRELLSAASGQVNVGPSQPPTG
jgi:hypothetical protein